MILNGVSAHEQLFPCFRGIHIVVGKCQNDTGIKVGDIFSHRQTSYPLGTPNR
jgi:hypothetical protein